MQASREEKCQKGAQLADWLAGKVEVFKEPGRCGELFVGAEQGRLQEQLQLRAGGIDFECLEVGRGEMVDRLFGQIDGSRKSVLGATLTSLDEGLRILAEDKVEITDRAQDGVSALQIDQGVVDEVKGEISQRWNREKTGID